MDTRNISTATVRGSALQALTLETNGTIRMKPSKAAATICVVSTAALVAAGIAAASNQAGNTIAPAWKNCTRVNKTYPHGVGKVGARDHTTGTPVTNFKRSNALYAKAMSLNKGLDRNKDGIACESS